MGLSLGFADFLLWGLVSGLFYYLFIRHESRTDKLLDAFPGPPGLPFIGHTHKFLLTKKENLLPMFMRWCEEYGPVVKTGRLVMLNDPKHIEKLVTSDVHIEKGAYYDFLFPWLGDSLLMSTGKKWLNRRKVLTPAFHFKILENFLPIINKESLKMVKILRERHGDGSSFDIGPFLTKCTLDIICETAMGKSLNAQDGENLEYSHAVREIGEVIKDRAIRPWLHYDFFWKRSALYKKQQKLLKVLHDFTETVIKERKQSRKSKKVAKGSIEKAFLMYFGKAKKKNAFLDLLLDAQEEIGDTKLSLLDIRDETDTFMFAGHDTTSAGITFTMFALGAYPKIQATVMDELEGIFGDDKERPVTTEDITKMKYLDCVIKESLRVYPSVPIIERYLRSDLKIGEGKSKHPFAYIPFSAGPRNCIGQKFALMEAKVIISNILRNFEITSLKDPKDLQLQSELTIRSPDGIHIKLTPR